MSLDERLTSGLRLVNERVQVDAFGMLERFMVNARRRARRRVFLAGAAALAIALAVTAAPLILVSNSKKTHSFVNATTASPQPAPVDFRRTYGASVRYTIAHGQANGATWAVYAFARNKNPRSACLALEASYTLPPLPAGGFCFSGTFDPDTGVESTSTGLAFVKTPFAGLLIGFAPSEIARVTVTLEGHRTIATQTVGADNFTVRFFAEVIRFGTIEQLEGSTLQTFDAAGKLVPPPSKQSRPPCDPKTQYKLKTGAQGATGSVAASIAADEFHGRPCRVRFTVSLTIQDRNGRALPIQGNGMNETVTGVLPESRPRVGWQWMNWCGTNPGPYRFVYRTSDGQYILDTVSISARCDAPGSPSTMGVIKL